MDARRRVRQVSRHLVAAEARSARSARDRQPAAGGAVYAQIPYRRATADGSQLAYIKAPQGPEDPLIRNLVEDPETGQVDAQKMRALTRKGISAMAPDAFDVRPHYVEDLRLLGATNLFDDGFVMARSVSDTTMSLLCPRPDDLTNTDHLREVAAERSKYKLEMEGLAREVCSVACPGHTVRLAMATGEANIFTRMTEPPCTTTPEVLQRGGPVGASGIVHSDLGAGHGRVLETQLLKQADEDQRLLLDRAGLRSAEELQACRHLILQLWRPITENPVQMDPLAVLDPRSLMEEDLFGTGLNDQDPPDQGGLNAGRFATYNPRHRWVHISNQTKDEVLIFAGFDSGRVPMLPLFHTSFCVLRSHDKHEEYEPEPRASVDAFVHVWLESQPKVVAVHQ